MTGDAQTRPDYATTPDEALEAMRTCPYWNGEKALGTPDDAQAPHKVMTPEEYAAMPIIGWHEVSRDVDGFGGVGVRFLGIAYEPKEPPKVNWEMEVERRNKDLARLERQLAETDALVATHANAIDNSDPATWPKDSLLAAAIKRHGARCARSSTD